MREEEEEEEEENLFLALTSTFKALPLLYFQTCEESGPLKKQTQNKNKQGFPSPPYNEEMGTKSKVTRSGLHSSEWPGQDEAQVSS